MMGARVWIAWIVVLGAGCASGGTDVPDVGAGRDGGGTLDAAPSDAARSDASAGDRDARTGEDGSAPPDAPACATGATEACSTPCGSAGVARCAAGAWSACSPPPETCNGADDDCDGAIDEGSRAQVLRVSYAADVTPRHPPCDGASERIGPHCAAAIHRYCAARGCTASGFGPDENAGDALDVTCVVAETRNVAWTTLATHHDGCTAGPGWTPTCNAAIHRFCVTAGFSSGFGPIEQSPAEAAVACLRGATVMPVSYASTLAAQHAGCDGSTATRRMGPDCNAAMHRHCIAAGFTSGYGPVESDGDTAYVACVRN